METRQVGGAGRWPVLGSPAARLGWELLRPPTGTHQEIPTRTGQLCPWEVGAPCRGAEGRSLGRWVWQVDGSQRPEPERMLVWRERQRWELVVGWFVLTFSEPDETGEIRSLQGRDPGPSVPTMPAARLTATPEGSPLHPCIPAGVQEDATGLAG